MFRLCVNEHNDGGHCPQVSLCTGWPTRGPACRRVATMLLEDPTFADELESWYLNNSIHAYFRAVGCRCEERCGVFDPSQDEDEHLHSYTELHKVCRCTRTMRFIDPQEFCLLVELRIQAFLRKEGYSVLEFWQRLMKAVDDDPKKALEGGCRKIHRHHLYGGVTACVAGENMVVNALRAATDYSSFATTMRAIQRDQHLRK